MSDEEVQNVLDEELDDESTDDGDDAVTDPLLEGRSDDNDLTALLDEDDDDLDIPYSDDE